MAKNMQQLLLPLETPQEKIVLPKENEQEIVAAMAMLLLQVLAVECGKEGEDDPRS